MAVMAVLTVMLNRKWRPPFIIVKFQIIMGGDIPQYVGDSLLLVSERMLTDNLPNSRIKLLNI